MRSLLGRYRWDLALVAVAAVWGLTFVTVKEATDAYPTFAFLGWRFAIAVAAFVALFPRSLTRLDRRTVAVGLAAGLLLTAGYAFQTLGLHLMGYNASSRSGFITGMFVVVTPLLQVLVLRHPPRAYTLAGVVLGTAGLLALSADAPLGWSLPDTLVLLCAVAYAAQFIVIGGWGEGLDVGALTLVQLATAVVGCVGVSLLTERAPLPSGGSLWFALVLTGVLASAVAFWVQTAALRHLSPTRTALVLIMEPVFAGLFGFLLRDERLGWAGWGGSALILAGMLTSEVAGPWLRARREGVARGPAGDVEPALEAEA